MAKIHVYLMPGMAASSAIFERIELTEALFEVHLLEWEVPTKRDTLESYAQRMALKVIHQDAILIGVSFGGILVQEMKAFLNVRKIIIISSVKSRDELSRKMKIARATKVYRLLPTTLVAYVEQLSQFAFGPSIKKRLSLYEKFLSVREKFYLDWSIYQIVNWDRAVADSAVIHIHGDADEVFPIHYIKDCIVVKGGTHIMILNKYKWLNENLPKIMLD